MINPLLKLCQKVLINVNTKLKKSMIIA